MSTTLNRSPFLLTMGAITRIALTDLSVHFDYLPDNPYEDGAYRKRRFSAFTFQSGKVQKLPHRSFSQSSDINTFQGGVVRDYEDITTECYESAGFAEMLAHYYKQAGLPHDTEIEIHQIRIQAKPGETVEVAPEGVHQDGFKRIGMFMINYQNITGGALKVHTEKESPAMTKYLLNNGEYIILNDAHFWHDAEDITGIGESLGFYDLFVLTGIKDQSSTVKSLT